MQLILLRGYDHEILYAGKRMLILGFILPTAFLSMWISNTATTAMMVPILEAVIAELESAANDTMVHFNDFVRMLQGWWNSWGLRARAPPLFEERLNEVHHHFLIPSTTPILYSQEI